MRPKPETLVDLDTVSNAPLPHMMTTMVSTTVTDGGSIDHGAVDRSIAVARYLARVGIWDGNSPITISDPYIVHDRLNRWVLVERMNGQTFVQAIDAPMWGNSPDESEVPNEEASKHTVRDILSDIHATACDYRHHTSARDDHYILQSIKNKVEAAMKLPSTERIGYKRVLDNLRGTFQITSEPSRKIRKIERIAADALALPSQAVQS